MLEGQDLIDQLETEKMMAVNSLRRMVSLIESMVLDNTIPRGYIRVMADSLDMSWTALSWIDSWDAMQRIANEGRVAEAVG